MVSARVESWGKVLLAIGLGIAVLLALRHGFNPLERRPSNDSQATGTPASSETNSNRGEQPSIDEADPKPSASDLVNGPMTEEKAPGGKVDGAAAPAIEAPPISMEAAPAASAPVEAN